MKAWICKNRQGQTMNGVFLANTKGEAKAKCRAAYGEKPAAKPGRKVKTSRKRLPVGYRIMRG